MTKEKMIDIVSLLYDGATLQEVGDKYGVTRQYISKTVRGLTEKRRYLSKSANKCCYPAIRNYMLQNHMSFLKLYRLMQLEYGEGLPCYESVKNALTKGVKMSADMLLALSAVTSIPCEEIIRKDDTTC